MTEVTDRSNRGMHADAIGFGTPFVPRCGGAPASAGGADAPHRWSRLGRQHRLARCWAAAGLAVCAAVLSACGGGTSKAEPHSSTTSSAPASTTSSADAAVLSAYRAAWAAFLNAARGANPADPALAATMTGPQLQGVKANLLADQRQGIVGRGSFTLHPKVVSITGPTATVVDCVYSTAELVYKVTGKPVPPVTPPENDGVRATLVLAGGTWKVDKQTVTDGKCAAGS